MTTDSSGDKYRLKHALRAVLDILFLSPRAKEQYIHYSPKYACFKGAPDPVAREVYRGLLCLRKILQKPTDSVPQQDCEYQKLKSGLLWPF